LKLGMIKKAGGGYEQTSPLIATDPEVNSFAVVNFHRAMGNLAVESLDRIPKNERSVTSCTVRVSPEIFAAMRKKTDDFRQELLALADSAGDGDRVYQVNFQLFPVSKNSKARR
jgi:uncharacterized protein (TIGR02147 family)